MDRFIRTQALFGAESMKKLADSKVIVFGVGGVGGYTVEALARSGVGNFVLVDLGLYLDVNPNNTSYINIKIL